MPRSTCGKLFCVCDVIVSLTHVPSARELTGVVVAVILLVALLLLGAVYLGMWGTMKSSPTVRSAAPSSISSGIRGVVADRAGAPVPYARLEAEWSSGWGSKEGRQFSADSEGRFEFAAPEGRTYRVRIRSGERGRKTAPQSWFEITVPTWDATLTLDEPPSTPSPEVVAPSASGR